MHCMYSVCTVYIHVYSIYIHCTTWRWYRLVYWGKYLSGTSKIYVVPLYTVCTCICNVCTCIYNVCALYNQLSEQVFMADREMQMQDWGTLRDIPRPSVAWDNMDEGPVQKMVNFFMPGQMLQKQRRPSTVVVYAYNMWYSCTVYVHVYMYTYVQCMCMV